MATKKKDGPSPQAVNGWKKKAEHVVELDAELAAKERELEARLRPIREKFEPDIEKLKADLAKKKGEVVTFANDYREELFADGSEIRTKTAIITGKATAGSVQICEDKEPREVLATFEGDRSLKKYLKITTALDKPAIKRALTSAGDAIREALTSAGVEHCPGFSVTVKGKGD